MLLILSVALGLIQSTIAGKGDTIEQLKVGYGNIDLNHVHDKAEVVTLYGQVPKGLNGTLIRQGCGVFGNSFDPLVEDQLDRINHVFDCIELAQSFHFHDGQVSFTSRFYDTNRNDYFLNVHNQDMTNSSVFFGTVYANFSIDAIQDYNQWKSENEDATKLRNDHVYHVSWWLIGQDVLSNAEGTIGMQVDPHNVVDFMDYDMGGEWPEHDRLEFNPAHEAYDTNLGLISTIGLIKYNADKTEAETKRIVYTINQKEDGSNQRNYIAEIPYPNANLSLCELGQAPDPNTWIRYLHTIASTDNYIIIPETSYLRNPCDLIIGWNGPGYSTVEYVEEVNGRFSVIDKKDPSKVTVLEADTHFFITHKFNAFEDDEGVIHVDVLNYDSSGPYTEFTYVQEAVFGGDIEGEELRRYSLDLSKKTVTYRKLHNLTEGDYVEFSNCNPDYAGKPYRYGYAGRNIFKLNNAVMKFDFEDPKATKAFELNDGEFVTEQVFVPDGGPNEDDGWVVVQTIDGVAKKANIVVLDGKTMNLLFRGQAPELGLHGLHSGFFSFDQGCSIDEGCIPTNEETTTTTEVTTTDTTDTTTIPSLASKLSFTLPLLLLPCIEKFFFTSRQNL